MPYIHWLVQKKEKDSGYDGWLIYGYELWLWRLRESVSSGPV